MNKLFLLGFLLFLNYQGFAQKKKCDNFNLSINAKSEDNGVSVFNEYGDGLRLCQGSNIFLDPNFNTYGIKPEIRYSWILPNGSEIKTEKLPLKNLQSTNEGEYTLVAKLGGTCLDTTIILKEKIKVDLPKVTLIEGNVCVGSDIQLMHNKNNSYPYFLFVEKSIISFSWTGPNGFSSNEDKPIVKNVKEDGVYKAKVSFSGYCVGSYELITNVNAKKESNVETSSSIACLGGSITVKAFPSVAGASGKYIWKGPNGFLAEGQEVLIKNLASKDAGAYKVISKYENGCANVDSNYFILNLPEPIFSLAKVDEFCEGSAFTLPRTTGYYSKYFEASKVQRVYKWTGPNNFESTLETPFITNFSKEKAGTYTLTVAFSGECQTTQTLTTNINPVAKPTLSLRSFFGPNELCKGANVFIYSIFSTYFSGVSTFSWTGPKNFTSSNSSLRIENFDESNAGNYELTMITKGCKEPVKASINLKVASERKVYAYSSNSEKYFCKGSDIGYDANCNINSIDDKYIWSGPNGFKSEDRHIQVKNLSEKNEGIYTVSVTSSSCPNATTSIGIYLMKTPRIVIPDSVSICEGGFKEIIPTFIPNNYGVNYYSGGHLTTNNGTLTKYEWAGPNNFNSKNPRLTIRNFNSKLEGEYELKATFSGGCEGIVSKRFKIFKNSPNIDWNIEKLCNEKVLITPIYPNISEKVIQSYSILNSKNTQVSNPIDYKNPETYTLISNLTGACTYFNQKTVDIKDAKPFKLSLPEVVNSCEGESTFLFPSFNDFNSGRFWGNQNFVHLNYSSSIFTFSWEKPNKSKISSLNLNINPSNKIDEGIYKLTGVLSGECTGTYEAQTKLIVDSEKPVSNFDIIQDKQTLSFKNNSKGRIAEYLWDFGNAQKSTKALPDPIEFEKEGNYLVKLDVSNGCGTSSSSKSVNISKILVLGTETPNFVSDFTLFPNPSQGNVVLGNSKFKNLHVFVSDLNGNLVGSHHVSTSEATKAIDLSNLSSNTYLIKTIDDKGFVDSKKIIIIR
jgi:PKD repeat protein